MKQDNSILPALTDVSVLLVFFNRPATFRQVFEQVRQSRPSRLFLYQDGPRNERDLPGIKACRKIVEEIDWECDVHQNFLQWNQGCDPTMYRAVVWAFSMTDKLIILEDDVVPSLSFIPFCKEMLDRYEHDQRIMMVSGFNIDEVSTSVKEDYFFTSVFSIWGWATWRRVADLWDPSYSFLDDPYNCRQLESLIRVRKLRPDLMKMFRDHSRSGKEYFETIVQAAMLLNHGLAVMPARNLVNNIGMTAGSTHYQTATLKTLPHKLRRIFTMKRWELDEPLNHPQSIVEDTAYKDRLYKVNAWGHPWRKVCYSIEELLLNLRYGYFFNIAYAARKRICKWLGLWVYE